MYSNIRSVQILVSLLHEFNIKDIVMSPGGSDIPIIHSIETDDFFQCYSVVDERSAAYYAMGIAQEKKRPVACVCTSGTAVCNYLPGITEAYYQNVPVIAITSDKNPYFQDQLETQKIRQEHIFDGVIKKSVSLPLINNMEDEWLCNRLINEALLELDHHGKGPVQINIPILGSTAVYDCFRLPKERKITRIDCFSDNKTWNYYVDKLKRAKRIMIVVGQNVEINDQLITLMDEFFDRFNCMFSIEHLSNIECKGALRTYPVSEMGGASAMKALLPDIVISLGNNLASYKLKPFLRNNYKKIENWLISEVGMVRDAYKCLNSIFEIKPNSFFEEILKRIGQNGLNDRVYYNLWDNQCKKVTIPKLDFWNFLVGQELSRIIPENSVLHLAILNSTRMMQFFPLKKNITVYSNVGALGIDGCFSTFAGHAAATDKMCFLLIGDLSFFYDMNAAGISSISNNVRIIMINNTGGSEFHFFMGKDNIPTINDYICAKHFKTADGWICSLGFEYSSARNAEELNHAMATFADPSDKPRFLEIFTDMEDDAKQTNSLYAENFVNIDSDGKAVGVAKNIAKSILSPKQVSKAKKILKL